MNRATCLLIGVLGCGRINFAPGDLGDGGGTDASIGDTDGSAEPMTIVASFGDGTGATFPGTTADTWLASTAVNSNFGADLTLVTDAGQSTLIRFDLVGLAPTAVVVSAELRLWTGVNEASEAVNLHVLSEAWGEGVATWASRISGAAWAGAGATGASRNPTPAASFIPITTFTEFAIALPSVLVQSWVTDPAGNHGLVLESSTGLGADFESREASNPDRRPMLKVVVQP